MENFVQNIKENCGVRRGDVVAVALSGGSDSIALAHKLKSLENELDIEVIAIHVNHQIRENAKRDEAFVKAFCDKNNIRCYSFTIDVPKLAKKKALSLESAGREARYGIFDAVLKKGIADKIALAHHKQDQAETILMHLFRGAGISGIRGMEYKKNDCYIRPLLGVTKKQIFDYIAENNLEYVEDETNSENTYARNFIRNEILPLLEQKWPNVINNLISFSKSASEDDNYIQKFADSFQIAVEDDVAKIPLEFFQYDAPIVSRIIFKALHSLGVVKDIEKKHIELIINLANNLENGKKIALPLGVTAFKEYEYVTLTNRQKNKVKFCEEFKCGQFDVPNFGTVSIKRVSEINPKDNTLYLDYKKIPAGACWRYRKDGDIFTKFGGGTKKLKSYLIDKKIPAREREFLPVLAYKNEVLAIAGFEISDNVKIDDKIRSAIKIEVIRNKNI